MLSRWFPKEAVGTDVPTAKYLDLILYSREQIRNENEAMGEDSGSDAPWGIVSIKAQDVGTQACHSHRYLDTLPLLLLLRLCGSMTSTIIIISITPRSLLV